MSCNTDNDSDNDSDYDSDYDPNYYKDQNYIDKLCRDKDSITIDYDKVKEFLNMNIDTIRKNYVSSELVWNNQFEHPMIVYVAIMEENKPIEFLLLVDNVDINGVNDILAGYGIAYKEHGSWIASELTRSESHHKCNICYDSIKIGDYSCDHCDFDLCATCYQTRCHIHPMYQKYVGNYGMNTCDIVSCVDKFPLY